MPTAREPLTVLRALGGSQDLSLAALAKRAGWSRFHFHRAFRRVANETPKQYSLRLRLERAAADLLGTDTAIFAIARTAGFTSHEVFSRAFRRHFGVTPREYRAKVQTSAPKRLLGKHRKFVIGAGPCIRMHYLPINRYEPRAEMTLLSIERKEVLPTPFLYVRRQAARSEVSQTLAECFGIVFGHAMQAGLALAGFPLARYSAIGPGLMTIDAGAPLAQPAAPVGEMQYCELPGGPVVFAIHGGPYDNLGDTHAAIERWMQERKLSQAGPHWEWYVTSPAQHPDPKDWRTHIYYPLEEGNAR